MTALIRLSKPCDECGGTDEVGVDGRKSSALNPAQGPCPSCVWGWLPDDDTVEAAAEPIHNISPKCYEPFGNQDEGCSCPRKAREALVAAARYQSEGKP